MAENDLNGVSPSQSKGGRTIDWGRFGLSSELHADSGHAVNSGEEEALFNQGSPVKNELFHEHQSSRSKPWWKTHSFLTEPVLFGTWDGVFTSCMINLFGVIVFLRSGWIVGNAGIGLSVVIVLTTVAICTMAVLSGISICERCQVERGGIHFLLSHVLGARIGSAVSVMFCFGQAVSCALHSMGFAESIAKMIDVTNPWVERSFAFGLVLLLLGINIAGVKWVVRLQFTLLILLLLAALDFAVGTFVRTNPDKGVIGYDIQVLANNSGPDYMEGQNWFTVFGVFFPAMTGIFAGINMSGDLHSPSRDIPNGTLASVGTSLFIYLLFILGLGATCQRDTLQHDYMIAEKASAVGVFLLAGLYTSSLSAALGSLYATPRIIQSMANEKVIPLITVLGHGKGPNKVPVYALVVFVGVSFLFILIGQINTLAPIVTIPFLLTYASVEYAYFSLAMTFDIQQRREERFNIDDGVISPALEPISSVKSEPNKIVNYGTADDSKVTASDLDQLFPERVRHKQGIARQPSSHTTTESPLTSPDEHSSVRSASSQDVQGENPPQPNIGASDRSALLDKKSQSSS